MKHGLDHCEVLLQTGAGFPDFRPDSAARDRHRERHVDEVNVLYELAPAADRLDFRQAHDDGNHDGLSTGIVQWLRAT